MSLPRIARTTGWGVFCACSWTWCIGMYLPIIMLQRFGWPGFLVFAVPNVIGCALFGYALRDGGRSQALVARHGAAMRWFSLVTLAYHVFFIGFACFYLLPPGAAAMSWLPLVAAPAMLLAAVVLSIMPVRFWPLVAVVVYAVSIFAFARIGVEPLSAISWHGDAPRAELPWLAPAIAFGFLLCPYLDPTFHRALQQSPNRHAFGVFGATFAIMLLLTCAYWRLPETRLTWIVGAHITVQVLFTMSAHLKEVRGLSNACCRWRSVVTMVSPLVALPLAYLGVFFEDGARAFRAMEDTYIRFLVFYALVFPAYVLLFMGPLRPLPRSRRSLAALVLIVVASVPIYEAGFLHHRPWLLVIPVGVLVLIAFATSRRPAAPIPATGMNNEGGSM